MCYTCTINIDIVPVCEFENLEAHPPAWYTCCPVVLLEIWFVSVGDRAGLNGKRSRCQGVCFRSMLSSVSAVGLEEG